MHARLLAVLAALACAPLFAAPSHSGLDAAGMDPAVRPQDDLFRAMNGRWLEQTAIPPDKADWGVFFQLRDRSDEQVRAIVEKLAQAKPAPGSVDARIATYYRAYMDTAAIDAAGLAPLAPELARIAALRSPRDLAAYMGREQGNAEMPLSLWVDADFKHPDRNQALVWQTGLGMPDRDYYLKRDKRFAEARAAYTRYLETLFSLAGEAQPARAARAVMALETRLARAQWDKVDLRNPAKVHNPMDAAARRALAPQIDWAAYLGAGGLPVDAVISVGQPGYVKALSGLMAGEPLAVWRQYLKARLLDAHAGVLPQPYREARFAYRGRALRGLEQDQPRWQKAIAELNAALGEALGQVYVAEHFPPGHKARMQALVANLMKAYGQSIDGLAWMSPATQAQARDKLAKYMTKIGYPDTWRSYDGLEVREGDALGNSRRAGRFDFERVVAKAGKPVDRREWLMTPQTVNAYYNPLFNEIVFPAAILQPPFFDMAADDAVNYGAIGAVIGHEISHGFDDQGSQFDGDGALRNWWTDADRKAFEALGARLVEQYGAYEPLPGHRINGKLTLGENIADLSGLQIAYKAYLLSLDGKPAPVIDGFTGPQRFFLGWAQAWRGKSREARLLEVLTSDPHSPDKYRANGAAINHDGYHEAFGTRPGDALYKAAHDRIRIW